MAPRSSTLYGDHDRIMKDAGIFPAVHCSMPNEDVPISHFHSNSDQHPLSHFQPPNQKFVCCGSCRQWLQVYFSLIFTIIVKCIHRSFTQAPIAANFVYCPRCGSCNNCSVDISKKYSSAESVSSMNALIALIQQCWYGDQGHFISEEIAKNEEHNFVNSQMTHGSTR